MACYLHQIKFLIPTRTRRPAPLIPPLRGRRLPVRVRQAVRRLRPLGKGGRGLLLLQGLRQQRGAVLRHVRRVKIETRDFCVT